MPDITNEGDWPASYQHWQAQRQAELAGPDSWLGMIGLFWLEAGRNALGSSEEALIRLPEGEDHIGDVIYQEDRVFWQIQGGVPVELATDKAGPPSTVDIDKYKFFIVDRDGRLAVRLRDREWAKRQTFAGLAYYKFDPAWRIRADWQPLIPPVLMEVPNVSGDLKRLEVAYQAVFEVDGERVTLLPMSVNEHEIFFVFRDRTSGRETYGAGRFLKAAAAVDGMVTLDFNRAFNPPCAFTAFATCPLPPAENWLSFPVLAGEKKPLGKT